VEELVRHSVQELLQSLGAEKRLEKLMLKACDALPDERIKQLVTIGGIGKRTAAVLIAKIGFIERFPSPDHLTSYFGTSPEENTSGVDKRGKPVPPGTMSMSRKGNDLVRKHLWMAAMVAITHNPQVKVLYARLRASGRRGDVALGHCMHKLLHQVFAIWTTGQPYDPTHGMDRDVTSTADETTTVEEPVSKQKTAAGRMTGGIPQRKSVTATSSNIDSAEDNVKQEAVPADTLSASSETQSRGSIDFPYLRSQITLERVLRHLGYYDRLRGSGAQRRGPCPVHGAKRSRGRTFSVHLGKNVYQCFHPPCGVTGNVLDLWCQIHQLTPYEAAIDMANVFDLKLHSGQKEKRNSS